jgi:hypothetical protein
MIGRIGGYVRKVIKVVFWNWMNSKHLDDSFEMAGRFKD